MNQTYLTLNNRCKVPQFGFGVYMVQGDQAAKKYNKTNVQIILRWHIQEGNIVFPKSTNPEHLKDNIDIFNFELTGEEMKSIRSLDKNQRYYTLNLQEQEAQLSQWKPAD